MLSGLPPKVAYERLYSFLSNANLISALLLSGLIGTAFEPLEIDKSEDSDLEEFLKNLANFLVAADTTCLAMTTIFTTYCLFALSGESDGTILRTVVNANALHFYQSMTFVLSFVMFVAFGLRNIMKSTGPWKVLLPLISFLVFARFSYHGINTVMGKMFPISAMHWARWTGNNPSNRVRGEAAAISNIKLEEIASFHGERIVREVTGREETMRGGGVEEMGANQVEVDGLASDNVTAPPHPPPFIGLIPPKPIPHEGRGDGRKIEVALKKMGLDRDLIVESDSRVLYEALTGEFKGSKGGKLKVGEIIAICNAARRERDSAGK